MWDKRLCCKVIQKYYNFMPVVQLIIDVEPMTPSPLLQKSLHKMTSASSLPADHEFSIFKKRILRKLRRRKICLSPLCILSRLA